MMDPVTCVALDHDVPFVDCSTTYWVTGAVADATDAFHDKDT